MSEELDPIRLEMAKDGVVLDDEIHALPAISPQCVTCAHLTSGVDRQCAAYPEGIPDEVWTGLISHKRPYQGDNGIHYQRKVLE